MLVSLLIKQYRYFELNDVSCSMSHLYLCIILWKILASANLHFRKRKILEAFFITKLRPGLNDQIKHHTLSLFRHGVT